MPMTADQIIEARRWVGGVPDDATLDATYDRVGTVRDAVVEILETRYAELVRTPASFTIVGEYAQNTGDNLEALPGLIAEARSASFTTDGDEAAVTTKRLVRAPYDEYGGR